MIDEIETTTTASFSFSTTRAKNLVIDSDIDSLEERLEDAEAYCVNPELRFPD